VARFYHSRRCSNSTGVGAKADIARDIVNPSKVTQGGPAVAMMKELRLQGLSGRRRWPLTKPQIESAFGGWFESDHHRNKNL